MNLQKVPIKRSISCYFCRELFEEQYLQAHINQCGQVLEPCRYKCGVYVPRKSRDKHAEDCIERRRRHRLSHGTLERVSKVSSSSISSPSIQISPNNTLRQPPPNLKEKPDLSAIEMKIVNQQHAFRSINNEVFRLQRFYSEIITRYKEFESTMDTLKLVQNDIAQKSYAEKTKNKLEFEKIQLKNEITDELIKQLKTSIDKLTQNIGGDTAKQTNIDLTLNHVKQRLLILEHLESELIKLQNEFYQDRKFHDTNFASLKDDFLGFKEYLDRENIMISGIWNEQLQELHKFKNDLNEIDAELKECNLKQHANTFQIKTNTQMSQENVEKITIIEKEINNLEKKFVQLNQNYEDLVSSSNAHNCTVISNTNGHIIWKINTYSEKLQEAINNNTVFRSPIFMSSNFGYKLRMEVHLNGIGRWKGRHLIMTMHVLKGEWDQILEWPCNLSATVILRDQNENKTQAVDLIKYLTARKKLENVVNDDITETSSQHIFIPHKTLIGNQYIKHDVIYFEVKINENQI